jgi:hypothetical protein
MPASLPAVIGTPMQLAFVPKDFDAALEHWTQAMGVGPFFVIEEVALDNMTYRGSPCDCRFKLALGYWGDMQIELIEWLSGNRAIYGDPWLPGNGAVHHTCILTEDLARAREAFAAAGSEVLVTGDVGEDGGVFYADTGPARSRPHAGGIVEVLQPASGALDVFAMIRDAARDWDGRDPVRSLA